MEDNKKTVQTPEPDSKDINQNVGSFSDNAVPAIEQPKKEEKSSTSKVETKQVEQEPEINFEKFNKTKKSRKHRAAHTGFGIKVEGWLSNPKKLGIIWLIILFTIAFIYSFSIAFIVELSSMLKVTYGPIILSADKGCAYTGLVFSYICILLPALPIVFLITSWFIGINGIYYSKVFHYIFWSILLFCLVLMIPNMICSFYTMSDVWNFHAFIPPKDK